MDYSKLLDQVDMLSDLLKEPLDLEATLEKSLKFILQAVQQTGGVLLVQFPDRNKPHFLISQELSQLWSAQIRDENSTLIKLAGQVIASGEVAEPNDSLELSAAVPVKNGLGSYGALLINGPTCGADDLIALRYFTRALARTLESDLFRTKASLRSQELSAIQLISTLSNSELAPDEMQARIARSLCRILDIESCSIVILDDTEHRIAFKKVFKANSGWLSQTYHRLDQGIISECIRTSQPIFVNNVQRCEHYDQENDDLPDVVSQSLLCAPILSDDVIQGAVTVYNKQDGEFDSYDQKILIAVANLLAYAMKDINLVQQLRVTSAELEVNRWQLLHSRNTLRALFDSIPLSFYIINKKYELVAINLSRTQRLGVHPSEIVGKRCYQTLHGRMEPCPGCKVKATLFGGKSTRRIERNFLENGEMIEWEINTYPIRDENGQVVQAIHLEQDMTEQRRLENQVIQSEKLAVVGQLAAGVAHEINNPLSAIIANAQLLRYQTNGNTDLSEALELIELAGNKAAQVVRNLLNLARKDQYEFIPCDVNESIGKAISLVQHELISNGINLTTKFEENIPYVKLSQEHIQGIWTNLILNGIDAQKDRGSGEIIIETSQRDDHVSISVADKGTGIPPENLKRIFEPFYTTKDSANGTGLGLAICQKVIKNHGGQIDVQSKLGGGTKFSISLPI